MQGTRHVRSLIRLFIGAVLLCLAWVVLTSGQASAAERPAPARAGSDVSRTLPLVSTKGLEGVLGELLGVHTQPAGSPAAGAPTPAKSPAVTKGKPSTQKPSGTRSSAAKASHVKPSHRQPVATPVRAPLAPLGRVLHEAERQVVPVISVVDQTARSTVDAGLALAADVTAAAAADVPLAGQPLGQVTGAVLSLVRILPVVGVPSPIVPLPIGEGTPTAVGPNSGPRFRAARASAPDPVPPVLDPAGATSHGSSEPARGIRPSRDSASVRPEGRTGQAGDREPTAPGAPSEPEPAMPSQPSPTGGASQGAGDLAIASTSVVLPNPSMFGRSGADWRVPRGLPAHPGTRPD